VDESPEDNSSNTVETVNQKVLGEVPGAVKPYLEEYARDEKEENPRFRKVHFTSSQQYDVLSLVVEC